MNINVSDGKILEASGPLKGILKNYELAEQNLKSTGTSTEHDSYKLNLEFRVPY